MTILAQVIVEIYASKKRNHFRPPSRTKFPKSLVGIGLNLNFGQAY